MTDLDKMRVYGEQIAYAEKTFISERGTIHGYPFILNQEIILDLRQKCTICDTKESAVHYSISL